MPFNGSGTASPPAPPTFPPNPGDVISSAYYITVINDLYSCLTQTLLRDGSVPMTGALNLGTHAVTGVTDLTASGTITAGTGAFTTATATTGTFATSASFGGTSFFLSKPAATTARITFDTTSYFTFSQLGSAVLTFGGVAYWTFDTINGFTSTNSITSNTIVRGASLRTDTFIAMIEVAAASVSSPAAGRQSLFIDTADHKLKRKDSAGTVVIIG